MTAAWFSNHNAVCAVTVTSWLILFMCTCPKYELNTVRKVTMFSTALLCVYRLTFLFDTLLRLKTTQFHHLHTICVKAIETNTLYIFFLIFVYVALRSLCSAIRKATARHSLVSSASEPSEREHPTSCVKSDREWQRGWSSQRACEFPASGLILWPCIPVVVFEDLSITPVKNPFLSMPLFFLLILWLLSKFTVRKFSCTIILNSEIIFTSWNFCGWVILDFRSRCCLWVYPRSFTFSFLSLSHSLPTPLSLSLPRLFLSFKLLEIYFNAFWQQPRFQKVHKNGSSNCVFFLRASNHHSGNFQLPISFRDDGNLNGVLCLTASSYCTFESVEPVTKDFRKCLS